MRRIKHIVRAVALFLTILMLALPVYAATDLGLNVNGVTATTENQSSSTLSPNGDGSWTNSDGVLSGVAKGKKGTVAIMTYYYTGKATLTFSIPQAGTFSFKYKDITLNSGSLTIDGSSVTAAGNFTKEFTEAGTVTVVIESAKATTTTSATIYDISFLTTSATGVTFKAVSGVDYKVNGVDVTEETGDQLVSITTDTVSVTATYDDSTQIIREWKAEDGSAYSLAESGFAKPSEAITLTPVLGPRGTPQFTVNGARYYTWAGAFTGISNTIVTVTQSGTLPAGDYTVPSGVTLLVPFDTAGTCYTDTPEDNNNLAWESPTSYRTLTLASGTHLTINGAMSLSAKHHTGQALENCGLTTGKYGHVDMAEDSTITVNDGGTLYAWGYITGSGSVTVKSGAKCYEYFVVQDFKDGNSLSDLAENKDKRVFMMNNYYVQNIVVPVTIEAGGYLTGYSSFFFQTLKISKHAPVPFVTPGDEDGLFKLSSGEIEKRYDYASDRLYLDIAGEIEMGNISITGSTGVIDITINSEDYDMPISSNVTLTLKSGAELNLSAQSLVMIPGAEMYIEERASLNIKEGQRFVLHDIDQWQKNYCYNAKVWPLAFVPNRTYKFQDSDLKDPLLVVNGTVDASSGYLYTTAGGSDIHSTGYGVVKLPAYSESTNSQYMRSGQTFDDFDITTAWLKNADGTFVKHTADTATDYTYNSEHGKWATEHTITDTVTAPTCTEKGYTTHTCTCGYTYTDSETDATGHTDNDNNHICEVCNSKVSECADADNNHACDLCKEIMSHCADENSDHACDLCGQILTKCTDSDGDKKCDICGAVLCVDADHDLICDDCDSMVCSLVYLNAAYAAEVELMFGLQFPADILNSDTAYVKLTKYGRWGPVETTYTMAQLRENGLVEGAYITEAAVASGEMGRNVSVQVFDGDGNPMRIVANSTGADLGSKPAYAVVDYAKLVLQDGTDAQKAVTKALLVYGGYAQQYFKVDQDQPVYNVLTELGMEIPSLDNISSELITDSVVVDDTSIGISVNGHQPYLDSAVYLRLYFALADGSTLDDYTFKLTYIVNRVDQTREINAVSENNLYFVDIPDIPAAYLDHMYTITATQKESGESYAVMDSVLCWVKSVLNAAEKSEESGQINEAQVNLAKAIYFYNYAANTFFNK